MQPAACMPNDGLKAALLIGFAFYFLIKMVEVLSPCPVS